MKLPSVSGKVIFDGLPSAQFWIRVFELEDQIAFVQARINQKPQRRVASVPIINEYIADPGKLKFYYAICLEIDVLGVQSGLGAIFFSDAEHEKQAKDARDKIAVSILDAVRERHSDETEGYLITEKTREPF